MSGLSDLIPDPDALVAQGLQHVRSGRLAYGKEMVQRGHALAPRARSLHALGVIAKLEKNDLAAADLLGQALAHEPTEFDVRLELVETLQKIQPSDVAHHLSVACALRPDSAEARAALVRAYRLAGEARFAGALGRNKARPVENCPAALAAVAAGDDIGAEGCFAQFLALNPRDYAAWSDYGSVLLRLGRFQKAVDAQRRALDANPAFAPAHHNLGAALQALGDHAGAAPCYVRAIACGLVGALTWRNLALAYRATQRHELAFDAYRLASLTPTPPGEVYAEMAEVARDLARHDVAIDCMKKLEAIWPDNYLVYNNLGTYLLELGQVEGAVEQYRKASSIRPDSELALANLASAYELLGRHEEALGAYDAAAALKAPDANRLARRIHVAQHICMWRDFDEQAQRLLEMSREPDFHVQPFSLLPIPGIDGQAQLAAARAFAPPAMGEGRAFARRSPEGRIRLAYVSSDLYEHATTWLLAETLELHDRSRFEVHLYSYGAAPEDEMRRRLRKASDSFTDLHGMSDAAAAARILADAPDIAIDLKGYTRGCRPAIFARRVAPLQINYLGFPGTLGAPYYDCIVADAVVAPPDLEGLYSEKVIRLPHCYQPNDRRRPHPAPAARAALGLPDDAIVFCSFNNVYKITPAIFSVWMDLLKETPGSVLWILSSNEAANANLVREAELRGVPAHRLVFAPRMKLEEHFARFQAADVFLDTFPCSAHTTASDALWCGVPVVTLCGETFASRVAASILRAMGLEETVATDLAAYKAIALSLGHDGERLARVRAGLRQRRLTAPLFDSVAYTADLEDALATAWRTQAAGAPA